MNKQISQLVDKIREMEENLEVEIAKHQAELSFTIRNRKVIFEDEILRRHKALKTGLIKYVLHARLRNFLTAPLIYSLSVILLLLDLSVSIYQVICFPIYGIKRVKRSDYLIFDRRHLAYLNILEKINCGYCSYANGLIGYVREIAARTEQYWCPIKHAERIRAAHPRYSHFLDYGDAERYHDHQQKIWFDSDEKK
jgi:hypothetical protein